MMGNCNDCQVEATGGSQTRENKEDKVTDKTRTYGSTDGISNYIAGWKLTLEPDGNVF